MTQYHFTLREIVEAPVPGEAGRQNEREISRAMGSAEEVAALMRVAADRIDPDPTKQAGKAFAEEILSGLRGAKQDGAGPNPFAGGW